MEQLKNKPRKNRIGSEIISGETHSAEIKGGWDNRRIIFRWRQSLWKHVWKELLLYTCLYLTISFIYRYGLSPPQQAHFKNVVKHFQENFTGWRGVPLTFILGLYIGMVIKRWWEQYSSMPWPDDLALQLCAQLVAPDDNDDENDKANKKERACIYRRTIIRYCLVSYILAIRRQSSRLRARFITVSNIAEAGLLNQDEMLMLKEKDIGEMYTSRWWVPIRWCMEVLSKASNEGLIGPWDHGALVSQVLTFKQSLQKVKAFGNLPVPLVYSQVVTLAVYVYFGVALIGDQSLIDDPVDMVYPFFLTFKFLFYFGLLSVAKSIYNPWGTDEEDIQLNKLLSRHLKVAMEIVDDTQEAPEIQKDVFWGNSNPELLDEYDEKEGPGVLKSLQNLRKKSLVEAPGVLTGLHNLRKISVGSNLESYDPGNNSATVQLDSVQPY